MKKSLLIYVLLLNVLLGYSQIRINEIQSSNASTVKDNYNEYEDWIELYNTADTAVDVGGLVLKDNVDTWQIPTGDAVTIIPPKNYFLLWADDQANQGKFHTNFKLSAANGEFLGLYKSDSITEIESINFPPLSDDQSYGQCDDEGWKIFEDATPLTENNCGSSIDNKWVNHSPQVYPTIVSDFFEVHFPGYIAGDALLQVFTTDGRRILTSTLADENPVISTRNMQNGLHIIHIKYQECVYRIKIIIAHN